MGGLYTIGCSVLSQSDFIRNLKINNINVVADVRSSPYSKVTPQFNREELKILLKKNKILYGDFSKEFGARREESFVYEKRQVSFEKTKQLPIFLEGVQRIKKGLNMGYSIALMCTEKYPLDCHRFSLVARGIYEETGIECQHILTSGGIKKTSELENEMLKKFNLETDLFLDYKARVKMAYKFINEEIGYILPLTRDNNEETCKEIEHEENICMFG